MRGIHIFLNGDRGVTVLRAVLQSGHEVDGVIIPAGKKVAGLSESVSAVPRLDVFEAQNVNAEEFARHLAGRTPNLFLVAGFSTIFRNALIGVPKLGTINLHGGPVPQYRGGSPLNWQIINGESEIGLSALRMDEGINSGPVIAEARFPLSPNDDIATVHDKANALFGELAVKALSALEADPEAGQLQNPSQAQYWHQRNDADGRIDFRTMSALQIGRLVRGLTRPYPGAHAKVGTSVVRVFACEAAVLNLRGTPGRVCWIGGQGPYVVCANGAILVTDYAISDGTPRLPHGVILC